MIVPHIRWMIRRDMQEVRAIEKQCFARPWSEEEFLICLRQRNSIGMVAEHDDRVVGYMVYYLQRTQIDLVSLAVEPEFQRIGVGLALINKLKSKLTHGQRSAIELCISELNLGAQLFLQAQGFMCDAILADYYVDCEMIHHDGYKFIFRHAWAESEAQTTGGVIHG